MFKKAFFLLNAIAAASQAAAFEQEKTSNSENATEPLSALLDSQGNIIEKPETGGLSKPEIKDYLDVSRTKDEMLEALLRRGNAYLAQAQDLAKLPLSEQISKMAELTNTAKDKAIDLFIDKRELAPYNDGIEVIVENCEILLARPDLSQEQQKNIGSILQTAGEYYFSRAMRRSAEITLTTSLQLNESLYGKNSIEVAKSLRWLAKAQHELGHTDQEIATLTRALLILEEKQPNSLEHARVLVRLSTAEYNKFGNIKRRIKPLKRAVKILKELPLDPYAPSVGLELTLILANSGEAELAYDLFKAVTSPMLATHKMKFEDVTELEAIEYEAVTGADSEQKKKAGLEATLSKLEKKYGPQHYRILVTLELLASEAKLEEEKAYWHERALKICKKAFGEDHISVGIALARLCLYEENLDKKNKLALKALEIFQKNGAIEHQEAINPLLIVGQVYLNSGEFSKAKAFLLMGYKSMLENKPNEAEVMMDILFKVASIHSRLDEREHTRSTLEEAVEIGTSKLGKTHSLTVKAQQDLNAFNAENPRPFERFVKTGKKNATQAAMVM